MEVPIHRCYLSRTLLYGAIFSTLLAWILCTSRSHHDGRTVTLMLAKMGEGPLGSRQSTSEAVDDAEIDCEHQESCNGRKTVNLTAEGADFVENLCWGYEKDCMKKDRLFVPHCNEPPKPW